MRKQWKRRILINNPVALDPVQIKQDLLGGNQVIVQFSHPDFYGYLALHSISKVPLHFVNQLKKLKHLRILLGGREHIQEIEENAIDDLEIVRVRGFHDLSNIAKFKDLTRLVIEDQIQLQEIGFDREMRALEELTISNCKGLTSLLKMKHLPMLRKLRIFKTALDFDSFIHQELPSALSEFEFATSKSKVDQEIQESLLKLGFQKWSIT
jgi:protein phosphatase 1 regulatory subunit 7